jgi:hypothetical protein
MPRCGGGIALWSNCSEQNHADHALALAKAAQEEVARHVGYYLIDAGRPVPAATGARAPLAEGRADGFVPTRRALLEACCCHYRLDGGSSPFVAGLVLSDTGAPGTSATLPASELAVLIVIIW